MKSATYLLPLVLTFSALATRITEAANCVSPARDCKELFDKGVTCDGVYTVKPDDLPAFEVYCDMNQGFGGGWTVFQRRMDGTVNFYRKWADYVKGFGDLNGEFWLGLDKIHRLTAAKSSLLVNLKDFADDMKYAEYSSFKVEGADKKFTLKVSGYTGDAGDSLTAHNNRKFTTQDSDNDTYKDNCAVLYKGAWWYYACHSSNLNGLYLVGPHSSFANGVNWYNWKKHNYSLRSTEMKTRRN